MVGDSSITIRSLGHKNIPIKFNICMLLQRMLLETQCFNIIELYHVLKGQTSLVMRKQTRELDYYKECMI